MQLITTLNVIREHSPCTEGWINLLTYLDKSSADDEPLNIMEVLKSNNIEDAIWCLRCFDYRDYCLFLADIAESVLPIYEEAYPYDKRPALAIKAIRDWHEGKIAEEQLRSAADAAYYAAYAAADAAYYAAYAAADAAFGAAFGAAAGAAGARKQNWKEAEQLFIKHFGDNT